MKLLGKLKAASLVVGDHIRVAGYVTKITAITTIGVRVVVETEMFEDVGFDYCDKVSLFSPF